MYNDGKFLDEMKVLEHIVRVDPHVSEAYNPGADESFDNAEPAMMASYTEKDIEELSKEDSKDEPTVLKREGTKPVMTSIIGSDNREQVDPTRYPYSAVCKLYINFNGRTTIGTGCLINPRIVLTAGNCVYSRLEKCWASSIEVIPGLDGRRKPFGSAVATRMGSLYGWTKNGKFDYDIGVIVLPPDKKLGNTAGWFGFRWNGRDYYRHLPTTVAGYGNLEQWRASGDSNVLLSNGKSMRFYMDTGCGQNGSPVWETGQNMVVAVSTGTYGRVNGRTAYNYATVIDESVFNWIMSYVNKYR